MGTSNIINANTTGVVAYNGSGNFTATPITNHNVLVAGTSNSITSVTPSTAGFVLTSNGTIADPSFKSLTSAGVVTTVNGDSGSATPSAGAITISGGSTGLTTSASSSTVNLTGTLAVANGGTGNSSLTAYALMAAGTTSTGNMQQVSGLGTSGQVLTSNGAGALPTWQASSGSSLLFRTGTASITTSGSSITFSSPFPTACLGVQLTGANSASGNSIAHVTATSTTGFSATNSLSGPLSFFYLAYGN